LPWLLFQDASSWKGPLAKQFSEEEKQALVTHLQLKENDAVVFVVGIDKLKTQLSGGKIRNYFGEKLRLKNSDVWSFVWIVDFPLFEYSEEEGKIVFSHNPFSMPQGGLDALEHKNPLDILAYQYDLVCNGIELSSGAIRNHRRDIMQKVFEIAGYSETELQTQFGALWTAFAYGAPPHGGIAPGIDRMIMLLKNESNIREIIAFPLNQKAIDPMMKAPCLVSEKHLEAIHIQRRSSCPS
jgi:aspartyl-tRNA synthetase